MAIADLYYIELLNDRKIKSHLLFFELGKNFSALVDTHHDVDFLLSFKITLILLNLCLHLVNVASVLEQGTYGLFTHRYILNVRLGRGDFLLKISDG